VRDDGDHDVSKLRVVPQRRVLVSDDGVGDDGDGAVDSDRGAVRQSHRDSTRDSERPSPPATVDSPCFWQESDDDDEEDDAAAARSALRLLHGSSSHHHASSVFSRRGLGGAGDWSRVIHDGGTMVSVDPPSSPSRHRNAAALHGVRSDAAAQDAASRH
jgi:hypothetical protein